jgi:hypothetical protein
MTKFNSQICTTRSQSEALLKLGLKKETADMWYPHFASTCPLPLVDETLASDDLPAWSLHRLIEMLNIQMQTDGRYIYLADGGFDAHASIYDNIIDCIEWLIKEGDFNKEYLER